MGLAASQARFLGLTARKSNVEYQVQQINQERTALSNEVMGLYSEYNKLKVPTPPSIKDFNKTVYTLDSTYEDYKVTNFSKILSGNNKGYYDVTLTYDEEHLDARAFTADCIISGTKSTSGTPGDYSELNITIGSTTYSYKDGDKNNTLSKITSEDQFKNFPGIQTVIDAGEIKDFPYYAFKRGDNYYYTDGNTLDLTDFENLDKGYTFYYQGRYTTDKDIHAVAAIGQGNDGRLASIQVIECADNPDLINHTYNITTTSEEDQAEYQEAMNDYAYRKDIYEKEVLDINKKTETLQEQDRSLELQLNQLDTEQKALSTEMDSVTKVIEDTIDSVFKTFNS